MRAANYYVCSLCSEQTVNWERLVTGDSPNITLYSTGSAAFYPSTIDDTTRVRIIYSGDRQQASIEIEGDGHISSNAFSVKGGGQDKVLIRHDGSALFKGAVQTGGGVVTPSAIIQTGADDPANYTTTMVDGQEEQVYSGPVLDVGSELQTALARIEALEAANASLEARLTALEGGSN